MTAGAASIGALISYFSNEYLNSKPGRLLEGGNEE